MCEVRPGHPDLWGSSLTGNIDFCFNLITFLWYYFYIFTHKYNIYIHILHSGIVTFTEVNELPPMDNNSDCYSYTKQSWSHTDTVNNEVNIYQINKQLWSNLRHKPVSLLLKLDCVPVGSHDAMSYCLDINSPLVRAESDCFRLLDGVFSCFTRPAIFRWATTQVGTENTTTALSLCRQRCEDNWEVSAVGAETTRSKVWTGSLVFLMYIFKKV